MKMNKKKVLVSSVAVCLIAILSVGTLAWFQAKDEVENIFQVSTDEEGKPDFKLDLFEHELDATTGELGTDEVEKNTYENVAPGDVLPKDPTVRNSGAYDQWVRIKVTLNNYDKWQEVLGTGYDFRQLFNVSTDWSYDTTTTDTTAKTLTLVYYKDAKLAVNATSTLFTKVTLPTEFTELNMPTEFSLDIVAEAIQADNTGDSAKAAFTNYWEERTMGTE